MQYRTHDGDVLDAICHRYYGTSRGHTERVLAANPGLAELGVILPGGVLIELPAVESPAVIRPTIRLWD